MIAYVKQRMLSYVYKRMISYAHKLYDIIRLKTYDIIRLQTYDIIRPAKRTGTCQTPMATEKRIYDRMTIWEMNIGRTMSIWSMSLVSVGIGWRSVWAWFGICLIYSYGITIWSHDHVIMGSYGMWHWSDAPPGRLWSGLGEKCEAYTAFQEVRHLAKGMCQNTKHT